MRIEDSIHNNLEPVEFDPFAGNEIIQVVPATEPQLEIWASYLIGGEDANRSYNESVSLLLTGTFNRNAMQLALEEITKRHDALRAAFSADGRQICIYKSLPLNLFFADLSDQNSQNQEAYINEFKKNDANSSFDLLNGPLFRSALFKLNEQEHYLTLTAHHAICDGWSLGIMMQDLSKIYSAYTKNSTPDLPAAPQFTKYSIGQSEFAKSEEYKKIEQYWVDQYSQSIPVMDIPTDYPRPTERTYKSHRDDYPLGKELVSDLKKMGAKAGASFVTTLMAAYEVFLHRLTGQEDIVLGIPAAGQSATGNYRLVGHCVNLLPLRSNPTGEIPFVEYLKKRKSKILSDYEHQQITFGSLLKKLAITRDASRVPLVPLLFNIDMGLDDGVSFEGLKHKLFYNPREYESFEIFINASGSEQSLILEWSYNTQLFKAATIKQMMDEFEHLLQSLIKEPSLLLKNIPLLSNDELSARLFAWNDTSFDYPKEKALHHLISETANKFPDKTAIRFGDRNIAYKDLNESANQLAALLLNYAVIPGDAIGLAVDRSPEMVIALLAIIKSGAAYVPLDPQYPSERVKFMLEDSGAKILITSNQYKGHFQSGITEILIENAWQKLSDYPNSDPAVKITSNDLAYILYTSGSTGKPKGVMIEHGNLVNFVCSMQKTPGITINDKLLAVTTISFDIAGLELYLPLISGAELVLADTESAKDGGLLLDIIEREKISMMQATPSTWRLMMEAGWEKKFPLKILCGGEALPKDLADKLIAKCDSLWNMYGPTETTIWSTVEQITADDDIITIGRPIGNTQVYILDKYRNALPEGSVGEIYIGGDGVARGYLNRPELSAEKFVHDSFAKKSGAKMYRTGDLGKFLADGKINCLGRIDHQVKIRGYRIELGEIEYALSQQEDIKEAVVIAREDKPGDQKLVAYVVLTEPNKEIAENKFTQNWREALRKSVPFYMVPNDFVLLSKLPLTPNGKIDRKLLPAPASGSGGDKKAAPENDTQKMVANIWVELLGVKNIGLYDDFFELGGHSLIAAQVMRQMEKNTGKRLPITTLFKYPVLDQFSSLFQDETYGGHHLNGKDTAVAATEDPETILLPAIEPQIEIWVSCILGGDDANRSYNISMSERLYGEFDRSSMERALQDVINRHESLRTTFSEDGTEICIHKKSEFNLYFEDISSKTSAEQQSFVENFAKRDAETAFDLLNGPLYRIALFKLGAQHHYLTFTAHHIICDGWSLSVIMQEISKLYSAYATGKKPDLQPAPRFRDYAKEQQAFYKSEEYKKIQQYWIDQFKNGVPLLQIPTDYSRPEERTYKSHRDDYALSKELISEIKKIGTKVGCSFSITVRAAFEILLSRITGQNDIILGLPVAGQLATDDYNLVGHCVNVLPVRSKIDQGTTFIGYLKERKIAILDAYDHQQLTFGSLLKNLNLIRDTSRVPLVPIVFNIEEGLDEGVDFYGIKNEMVFNPREYETFDISLTTGGSDELPTVQWSYNTQLFKASSIKSMMEDFVNILSTIVKTPDVKIKDIPSQKAEINKAETFLSLPKNKTVLDLFSDQVKKTPNNTAIIFENEKLTYQELDEKTNQLAHYLIEKGVKLETLVPLCINRSLEMIIGIFGIMKAGAAYVPIDPEYPDDRIDYMLDDVKAQIILTSASCKNKLPTGNINIIELDSDWENISKQPKTNLSSSPSPNNLAYVIYTSGSTGKPKGVMNEHIGLLNRLIWAQDYFNLTEADAVLQKTTFCFDVSVWELVWPLLAGSKLVFAKPGGHKDNLYLKSIIDDAKITMLHFVPSMLELFLFDLKESDCAGLKKVLCSGEALKPSHVKLFREKLPNAELHNLYGPTEAAIDVTCWTMPKTSEEIFVVPIGKPVLNTEIYILDENNNLLSTGMPGELNIGGIQVARGYLNKPELTSQRFVKDIFSKDSAARMYKTGDIAKWMPDGNIEYLGRVDDQVKIRGFRIELGEIENVLQQYAGVKHSVVIAKEDKTGDKKLVGYVVAEGTFDSKAAISYLESKLPEYMVPRVLMQLESIPLTSNGKADKKALPEPEQISSTDNKNYIAPRTESEKLVATVLGEALGLEKVSMGDNFFEMGGHSLIAIKVMRRLEEKTGKRLPLTTLFKYPLLEKFATFFDEDKPIVVGSSSDQNNETIDNEPESISFPATEPQIEIWVACVIGGDDANRSYNVSMSEHLQGHLDRNAMELALRDLINRQESLRATFSESGREMHVHKKSEIKLYFEDISSQSQEQQQSFLDSFARKDAETVFDLMNGPLFRISLIKMGDSEFFLTLTAHHIICDGWSLDIIMHELGKLYSAYASNRKPVLENAPQYSRYASEQNIFYESEAYKKNLEYWVNQYKNSVPVLNLPTDSPRASERSYKSRRDSYSVSKELFDAIKKIGVQSGCSLTITLRAAFEIFLYRLTGQNDIVVGLPAAGQSSNPSYYNLVGHCVNLLPVRSQFTPNSNFVDYLTNRRDGILDAYDHQELTFGSLLKKLNIARDKSRVPLVPVLFNIVEVGTDEGVEFYGMDHEAVFNAREYETFDIALNINIVGTKGLPTFNWSYNTQLFKPATISRMMEELKSLLIAITTDPATLIKEIPLRPINEIYAKLRSWNDTVSDYPKQKTFNDLFAEAVRNFSEKTALRFGQNKFSYRNLNEASNQFAALLSAQNIKAGDIVGVAIDRSPEMLITLLGILKSGAAYVPLDPLYPQKRIEFMLQDSSAKVLIVSKKYKGRFQSSAKEFLVEDIWPKLSSYSKEDIKSNAKSTDLAYILYTSGSTGNPKGVQIEQHSLVNFLLSMQKKPGITSADRLLAITTISFDIAGLELYLPLISGAELFLADTESARDGRLLLEILENQQITIMQATPSTWRMMMEVGWEKRFPLKILCGGEALPKDLSDKLLAKCDSLWNVYGPTETTIWSALKQILPTNEAITIGRPIDNTQIYILDDSLKPLPEGYVGEIYIGGDGVARGYLNRAELTSEKFIDNPLAGFPGDKIYRTGDLGKFVESGEIQCLGRIDNQVKIHGYRIELGEIEQVLNKQEAIKEAVVVANQDRLVAYVVPDVNSQMDDRLQQQQITKWRDDIKKSLPDYMLPKDFVLLKKLPLTPNGKIDRNALPKPTQNAEVQTQKYMAPRTDTEKLVASIWGKLLGLQEVSIYDDFFELGGHSLIAVQAMTMLEKETGKRLPLASLFDAPTVEKLALLVHQDERTNAFDSLVAIKPSGNKTPLYIVHGFGMNVLLFNNIAKNMDPEQPVYALQAKGLNTNHIDDSLDRMEDIAAYYISEIIAQNPDGPYSLAGYSLGGIIVFEMAKQLKAMGKEIRMVAMFDTYADNSNYFNPFLLNVTKKFRRQFPKMLFIMRSFMKQPWQTFLYQADFVKNKFRQLFRISEREQEEAPIYDKKLADKYEYAYVHYRMTPYDGSIDLFKVKTRLYYLDDLIYLGWKQFAQKGVNVYEITGDHKTFLYPPHDKEFAQTLQKILDERTSAKEIGKNTSSGKSLLKVV